MAAAKQLKHQQKRRGDAKCVYMGCTELTGSDFRCEKHAAEHAERMARYRQKRKAS